ncbi:hypothetical protein Kalk_08745 [Ketobacter alkanivorans]|uniref:Major facilitator superfamily (MFS) profile domain-containing protein n=2 Tax=Ketobacter alkanivorans TaxID=1917421 RepID=A0A2K9LNX7_9GAMM|nr:hypothetical protein Kalk_08745 [Ketobacter alkanivorans]
MYDYQMQTIIIQSNVGATTEAPKGGNLVDDTQVRRLSWAVGPMGLSQSAMLVYLPLLVSNTDLDYQHWAQLFAAGMLTYLVGAIAWPLLLPRLGHRRMLWIGLGGFAISMMLFGATLWMRDSGVLTRDENLMGLILSRLLYGVFASSLLPVTQSWSAQLSQPQQRLAAFSRISQQLALSRALGPILAAAAGWLHWLLLPVLLALLPLILITKLAGSPEPTRPNSQLALGKTLRGLIPPPWLGVIAIATTAIASSLQFQLSPALAVLTSASAEHISLTIALLMTAAAALSVIGHRLQIRHPAPNPMLRQLWIAALLVTCTLGLLLSHNLWGLCAIALLMSLGLAWLTPLYSTSLSLGQHQNQQHLVAAQLGLTHILGHLLGLSVTAVAMAQSLSCVYIWMTILGMIIAIANLSHQPEG